MKRSFTVVVLLLFITSCSNIGSVELPIDRLGYNDALQYSDMQQELLNIVRLRYSDPPYFMSVNSIVSQFSYSRTGSFSVSNNSGPPPALLGTGSGDISFSENPTITFTPLQGTEFVTKLMTPIDISVIYMLLRAGWGINHVLRPIVQRLGPYNNAVIASRVTSSRIPEYKQFIAMGGVLRDLQHDDRLKVRRDMLPPPGGAAAAGAQGGASASAGSGGSGGAAASKASGEFAIRFDITSFEGLSPRKLALLAKLGATPETPYFWLVNTPSRVPGQNYIETRTVLGLLNYFSKAVDVPPEDIKNKQAPMTYCPDGSLFNWHRVTFGMLHVHTSPQRPVDAAVSVRYRKKWFYIPESDFDSKETINLIMIIMGIYQGKIEGFLPVFTVS